jgi:transposase
MSSKSKQTGDTEVRPVAKQRTFTVEEKLRILAAYEGASTSLERAAVLRRERIYSSHISIWRKARDGGKIGGGEKPVGRPRDPEATELARLRSETARLQKELGVATFRRQESDAKFYFRVSALVLASREIPNIAQNHRKDKALAA